MTFEPFTKVHVYCTYYTQLYYEHRSICSHNTSYPLFPHQNSPSHTSLPLLPCLHPSLLPSPLQISFPLSLPPHESLLTPSRISPYPLANLSLPPCESLLTPSRISPYPLTNLSLPPHESLLTPSQISPYPLTNLSLPPHKSLLISLTKLSSFSYPTKYMYMYFLPPFLLPSTTKVNVFLSLSFLPLSSQTSSLPHTLPPSLMNYIVSPSITSIPHELHVHMYIVSPSITSIPHKLHVHVHVHLSPSQHSSLLPSPPSILPSPPSLPSILPKKTFSVLLACSFTPSLPPS